MGYDLRKLDIDELKTLLGFCDSAQRSKYVGELVSIGVSNAKTKTDSKLNQRFEQVLRLMPPALVQAKRRRWALSGYCEALLCQNDFETAERFARYLLGEEGETEKAYWTLLKARLKCADDDELIYCSTPIDTTDEFKQILALGADADFYIDFVEKQQKAFVKAQAERQAEEKKQAALREAERQRAQAEAELLAKQLAEKRVRQREAALERRKKAFSTAVKNAHLLLFLPSVLCFLGIIFNQLPFAFFGGSIASRVKATVILGPYVWFFVRSTMLTDGKLTAPSDNLPAFLVYGAYAGAAVVVGLVASLISGASAGDYLRLTEAFAYALMPYLIYFAIYSVSDMTMSVSFDYDSVLLFVVQAIVAAVMLALMIFVLVCGFDVFVYSLFVIVALAVMLGLAVFEVFDCGEMDLDVEVFTYVLLAAVLALTGITGGVMALRTVIASYSVDLFSVIIGMVYFIAGFLAFLIVPVVGGFFYNLARFVPIFTISASLTPYLIQLNIVVLIALAIAVISWRLNS